MPGPSSSPTASSPVRELAADLSAVATTTDQRRLLVLSGDRDAGFDAAFEAIEGAGVADEDVTFVTTREGLRFERLSPSRADSLLGTTRELVVCDAHEGFSPNLLGRLAGVVDGGGLLVLVTPSLDAWPQLRTDFDDRLAVPPFTTDDVTGRFRGRLVDVLRSHPGVAVIDVDAGEVRRGGDAADGANGGFAAGRTTAEDGRPSVSIRIPDDARA